VLETAKTRIYEAFCDNINTPGVFDEVDEAIRRTNKYIATETKKITLLEKAYRIISQPLKVMELEYDSNENPFNSNEAAIITAATKFRD